MCGMITELSPHLGLLQMFILKNHITQLEVGKDSKIPRIHNFNIHILEEELGWICLAKKILCSFYKQFYYYFLIQLASISVLWKILKRCNILKNAKHQTCQYTQSCSISPTLTSYHLYHTTLLSTKLPKMLPIQPIIPIKSFDKTHSMTPWICDRVKVCSLQFRTGCGNGPGERWKPRPTQC